MDELTQRISEFLLTNPNRSTREIGKEIGFSKNEVNSCLYANEGTCFSKEGPTPPLWMNIGESSETERAKTGLAASDEDESNDDFDVENEDQEEDWTRLDFVFGNRKKRLHVEVKGVSGSKTDFNLTPKELKCAKNDGKWKLFVVTNALIAPRVSLFSGRELIAKKVN